VTATWAGNTITISGTPTVSGTFNYSIPLTGGCGSVSATGTITITPNNTVGAASSSPTLCINTALTPNNTHTTIGATGIGTATGLPAGVTAAWASNTITISGTPTVSGTFNYSIPLTGGCGSVNATGIITVTPANTVTAASSSPTLCINTPLTDITHTTTGATGIGTATGLPAGVTVAWASNTITISGTPTVSGTFNYSIPLTGGCGSVNATGTITISINAAGVASSSPTLCINTALSPNITHTTTLATGIGTATGLPTGVTATWAGNTITISGTPTVSGTFNYSIPLTGGCGTVNATGTIIVNPDNIAGIASSSPTICINTALSPNITHTTTGATGIGTATGLPAGVTAAWALSTITISGTPTVAGTFNYSIPLTGGCGSVNAIGTIIVTPLNTATPGITTTLCIDTALSPNITHTTTGATGIGTATGLPTGVTAAWSLNTITISGTPTVSGTFNYSIPLTGGCGTVNVTGTITISINAAGVASSSPTICINTALSPNITHTTTLATGIGTATGLPTGVTATWAGNTITITGTPTVSGTFNYSIPLTGGCGAVNATGTIIVNPEPVVANQSDSICSDVANGIMLSSGSTVAALTYNITAINSNGLVPSAGFPATGIGFTSSVISDDAWTNLGTVPVPVIYTVVPVSAAGCSGDPFTVTVNVTPEPVVANQTIMICSNVAHGMLLGNDVDGPSAVTYNITSINPNGLTASTGNPVTGTGFANDVIADDAWTNTTPSSVNVIYTVVPVSAADCAGDPFTVTVTVESALGIADKTVTVCSDAVNNMLLGTAPNTTYTIASINTNGLVASSGNPLVGAGFLADEIADDAWTNTTTSPVNVIYTVAPVSANGCSGDPFTVMVTVNPKPVVANQSGSICSDVANGIILDAGSSVVAATYNITSINSNGLTASSGNPLTGTGFTPFVISDDAWTNLGTVPIEVLYTVLPVSGASCLGAPFTVAVFVAPEPVVVNQTGTTCSNVVINIIFGNDTDGPSAVSYNITNINSNGLVASAGNPVTGTGFSNDVIADDAWTNIGTTTVDVIYTVVPVSAAGCLGDPFTVTVTIESEIDIADRTVTVCSDTANGVILGTVPNATYNILSIVSNGLIASSGNPIMGFGFSATEIADDAWTNTSSDPVTIVYTVVPVSMAGCLGGSFRVVLIINPEPVAAHQTGSSCSDQLLGITINASSAVAAFTYNITAINSGGLVASSGNPVIGTGFTAYELLDDAWTNLGLVPVPVIYTIVPVSTQGCLGKPITLTATINPQINVSIATTPITCYGANDASITLVVTGGTAPYMASWSNLATGFYQNNLAAGTYDIVITDAVGCIKNVSVIIPEAPIFWVYPVVNQISCFGANNGSIALNLVGGVAPISLVWSDGSTAGTTRNNLGPGTYTVTITDSKPCVIVRTFIIMEPQLLVLSANLTQALNCTNANSGAIQLLIAGGTPPFNYQWSNGATTQDLVNIPAGNYMVTVTDSRGCTKTAQYSITRPAPLVANVTTVSEANCATKVVKQKFTAQITGGVPPYQLNWSSGNVSGPNNQYMETTQNGMVILTATDALGCSTNYTFNVNMPALGSPTFDTSSIGYSTYGLYSIGDPIQFTSNITGDYMSVAWNFGDGTFSTELNPIHTYVNPKDYIVTLTVTYPYGCVYTYVISLLVEKGYLLVVPNAFTPNNDNLNDTFRPVTKGLKNIQLDVYDTWGSLIFSEKGDVLRGWDGTLKGYDSENGNYYCKVRAETFYGTIVQVNHPFVLIK
jgi:gliding motility-associated-like protein